MNKSSTFSVYYLLLFFVFLPFILFSCNNDSKPKIGFLIPNSTSGRYIKEKEYFTKKIEELGGEAIILSAENNDQLQITQAKQLLNDGINVLVLNSINLNTAAAIVRDAHDRGVKVIGYDRLISNCDLDYLLTFDNEKVGILMAEYAIKLKPEGNYILLGGDRGDKNAVWVKNGQLKVLAPYINSGKIKIDHEVFIEDWSGDNAHIDMSKYFNLSNSFPDVILSSYDGLSTGTIDVLKEYSMEGKIIVTGQDAELDACQNIVKGYQSMTVYKSVKNLAIKAAELSMKIVNKEKITEATQKVNNGMVDVPAILLEPQSVDKSNMRETVIKDGYHTEKEIYGE